MGLSQNNERIVMGQAPFFRLKKVEIVENRIGNQEFGYTK